MTATEEEAQESRTGALEKRYVIYAKNLGLLLEADEQGLSRVWSSTEEGKGIETAITFTEDDIKIVQNKIKVTHDVHYVMVDRLDRRATKDQVADAGLPRW